MQHRDQVLRLSDVAAAIEIGPRLAALRAWIARRQVRVSEEGIYRAYSFEDVARLVFMRAATDHGIPPAEAGWISARIFPIASGGYDVRSYEDMVGVFGGEVVIWKQGSEWRFRLDHPKAPPRSRPPAAVVIDAPRLVRHAFARARARLDGKLIDEVDQQDPGGEPVSASQERDHG